MSPSDPTNPPVDSTNPATDNGQAGSTPVDEAANQPATPATPAEQPVDAQNPANLEPLSPQPEVTPQAGEVTSEKPVEFKLSPTTATPAAEPSSPVEAPAVESAPADPVSGVEAAGSAEMQQNVDSTVADSAEPPAANDPNAQTAKQPSTSPFADMPPVQPEGSQSEGMQPAPGRQPAAASEASPENTETSPEPAAVSSIGLSVPTEEQPPSVIADQQQDAEQEEENEPLPSDSIKDGRVRTMTTKDALNVLQGFMDKGEFDKVLSGVDDILKVDPDNKKAQNLKTLAEQCLADPEMGKKVVASAKRGKAMKKVFITILILVLVGAGAVVGWAYFGDNFVDTPTDTTPVDFNLMVKTDPVDTVGDAPFEIKFDLRNNEPVPESVNVSIEIDGVEGVNAIPYTHVFNESGSFKVNIVAKDQDGNELDSKEMTVIVKEPVNVELTTKTGTGEESLTVEFEAAVVNKTTGKPANTDPSNWAYEWSFGDGESEKTMGKKDSAKISHTYKKEGSYVAEVNVQKDGKDVGRSKQSVSVTEPIEQTKIPTDSGPPGAVDAVINTIPKSLDGKTLKGKAPLTVLFSAGSSVSENGELTSIHWDFGDSFDSSEWSSIHTYSRPGLYRVSLLLSDIAGETGTEYITVNVESDQVSSLPEDDGGLDAVIETDVDARGPAPLTINFDGSASTSADSKIESYEWDFGDESILGSGPKVSHTFQTDGRYKVTLKITDEDGNTAEERQTVNVTSK